MSEHSTLTTPEQQATDRPAKQYRPDVGAGWEWRVVQTMCAGNWRHLVCEVLWVEGKIVLARPLKAPLSSSAELLRDSLAFMVEAIGKAQSRKLLEVDSGLVDWRRDEA